MRNLSFALALMACAPSSWAATAPNGASPSAIEKILRRDLISRSRVQFETLLRQWQQEYGSQAVPPLLKIAARPQEQDPDRYVALMGAVKLGGSELAPLLAPFLKDKSWMIRSGALRALAALRQPRTSALALPLLQDPSLIVRCDAAEAIGKLNPPGAAQALIQALANAANYHAGKAQWVPIKALDALAELHAVESAPQLLPLLGHEKDPLLRRKTLETLEVLTGVRMPGDLDTQTAAWQKHFTENQAANR